jgi:16S rRNA (cytidine1402-2'-O)-methyltransferase
MKASLKSAAARPGVLYLCATPIGNLSDASFRLIDILSTVTYVAAEDTRVTQTLLARYHIRTKTISLQKFNESRRIATLIADLQDGKSVALVSDAGMPTLSDPGSHVVREAHRASIRVEVIPGPSAITALAAASGMAEHGFVFAGFFPRAKDRNLARLRILLSIELPLLFFESPLRMISTLTWISEQLPDAQLAIAKELTKAFEWMAVGSPTELLRKLQEIPMKGEWCFMMAPILTTPQPDDITPWVTALKAKGLSFADVVAVGAYFFNSPRNVLYRAYHQKLMK